MLERVLIDKVILMKTGEKPRNNHDYRDFWRFSYKIEPYSGIVESQDIFLTKPNKPEKRIEFPIVHVSDLRYFQLKEKAKIVLPKLKYYDHEGFRDEISSLYKLCIAEKYVHDDGVLVGFQPIKGGVKIISFKPVTFREVITR